MAGILYWSLKHGAQAPARAWEGARGLEWTVPSPAPHHTFETPPVIHDGDLAHGHPEDLDFQDKSARVVNADSSNVRHS